MSVVSAVLSVGLAMSALSVLVLPSAPLAPGVMQSATPEELVRQAKPVGTPSPIVVSGADPNNVILVVTTARNLTHNIVIQEVANRDLGDVRVVVWPLSSPTASSFPITVCGSTEGDWSRAPFPARELQKLCIEAVLLSVGTYRATLNISYRDEQDKIQRDSYVIAIERRVPPTTFSLGGLPVGPIETSFDGRSFIGWANSNSSAGRQPGSGLQAAAQPPAPPAPVSTVTPATTASQLAATGAPATTARDPGVGLEAATGQLTATSPEATAVPPPTVVPQPATSPPATEIHENPHVPVTVMISEIAGQEILVSLPKLVQFSQTGANDTIIQSNPGQVKVRDEQGTYLTEKDGLTLKPKSTRAFDLLLPVQLNPGQYRAKVEVSTADGAIAQTDIDIRVRHGVWPAFLTIVIGAFISYLLRQWIASGRARAMRSQQFERRLAMLRHDSTDPLVEALRERLESARDDPVISSAEVDEICRDTNELLVLVLDLRNRIVALALPENLARGVNNAERRARAVLVAHSKDRVAQSELALGVVEGTLEIAGGAQALQSRITFLRRQSLQSPDRSRLRSVDRALADAQSTLDDTVARAQIAIIDGAAKVQNGVNPGLAEARGTLERGLADADARYLDAAKSYLDLCEGDLTQSVDAWKVIIPQLKAGEDRRIDGPFLTVAMTRLDKVVAGTGTFRVDDDLPASLVAYDAIVVDVRTFEKDLTAERLAKVLDNSVQAPRALAPRVKTSLVHIPLLAGSRRSTGDGSVRRSPPWHARVGLFMLSLWGSVGVRDFLVTVAVTLFSALIGIQLLWIPNLTFGGLNDYITALVWGFGLHQLNEVARQGGPASIGNAVRNPQG